MTKSDTTPVFKNQNGTFKDGDQVSFEVENQISGGFMWDTHGTLRRIHDEWVIEVKQGTVTIGKGFDAYFNTIRRMPYLKEYDGPPIVELPEFPPEGQTVYIPHRKRDGRRASNYEDALTIKRSGNRDEYLPCGCKLCYEAWSRKRKRIA